MEKVRGAYAGLCDGAELVEADEDGVVEGAAEALGAAGLGDVAADGSNGLPV